MAEKKRKPRKAARGKDAPSEAQIKKQVPLPGEGGYFLSALEMKEYSKAVNERNRLRRGPTANKKIDDTIKKVNKIVKKKRKPATKKK